MRNRWFHPPVLHSPALGAEKRPTWLELFYDLIFVAAFIQLGNGLANHVSFGGFAAFAAVFVPMWVAWTGFTFFVNRFTIDDFTHRLVVFVQMFAVGAMAITAPEVLEGHHRGFSIAYAVAQAIIALLYVRAWRQVPESRAYSKYWGLVFAAGAAIWVVAAFVPSPWCYVLWGLGLIEIMAAPFRKYSRALAERFPNDSEHLSERYGLLTIIVLGESFVKVLSSLAGEGGQISIIIQASFVLLITCCIWWIYFDDIAGSRLKGSKLAPEIWLYGHLPLQIAITATGVAVKKAVHFDIDTSAPDAYRWLLAGALALVMFSVAIIDSVTERRQAELSDSLRVKFRFMTAMLLLVLAPAGSAMTAGLFLGIVTALLVAQVVFDMMMAPLEAEHEHVHHESIGEQFKRAIAGEGVARPNVAAGVGNIVRKGTPSEMRRDIYFYLMEGSWSRVFVALIFVFLVTNIFFAGLYLLEPGSVSNARPQSFSDAFFFSVQTISTIGYGTMSPATDFGHAIVTAEAAVGILGVALTTGLMFAKASRAKASVLFSNNMVTHVLHGKKTLVFRVGNARGNDVVDAEITVSALIDEVSPEGHHLRRLHDIKLVRNRQPLFMLSWVVMHELDESSPLHGCQWQGEDTQLISFVVTMTGHDGTYGETIYARHIYYPGDVLHNHRFVDIISEIEGGRLLIDYDHFHDTEPIEGQLKS